MADKTLTEVKKIFGNDKIFETETAFLVNVFGKYQANITFVVSKNFEGNPLEFRRDNPTCDMLAGMNIDFGGETSVLFGDFWTSKKGGACFRPKSVESAQHVLIRCGWGGAFSRTRGIGSAGGGLYYRRAASNGGGAGSDYLVVPIGYYRVVRDAEIDGDTPAAAPDFAARAVAIRAQFAQCDRAQADKAAAAVSAKHAAEVASVAAKAAGLGDRLVAVNRRRAVLGELEFELKDAHFGFYFSGWSRPARESLYTEAAVAAAECEVTQVEEKAALKTALHQLRVDLGTVVETAGCQLGIPDYLDSSFARLSLEAKDLENMSRGFSVSREGIEELRLALPQFLAEVEAKRAETRAKEEKEALEQRLREQGCPTDFTCRHERGHGKTHRQCWVIQPDGKEREADDEVIERHKHVATVWRVIRPGEIALVWEKSSAASNHRFTVEHLLAENPTDAQVETICAILEGIEERWESARGLASGALSPDVGDGWLHPVTGKSLTRGFKTSRQQREVGQSPIVRPNLDEPIKPALLAKSVAEGGERASLDALAALRARFGK